MNCMQTMVTTTQMVNSDRPPLHILVDLWSANELNKIEPNHTGDYSNVTVNRLRLFSPQSTI